MRKYIALLLTALLLTGCGSETAAETQPATSPPAESTDLFTDRDFRTE